MRDISRRSRLFAVMTALMGLMVVIGCLGRCAHIDRRLFWADEVVTSLRVAGYTIADLKSGLFDGRVHSTADAAAYQTPGVHATLPHIVTSLADEDAQHPPLYYLLERAWVGVVGNGIAERRSSSVVFSLLALPALYWLCLELFAAHFTAVVAVALAAVSPFFEVYAKQAREYSLWELLALCGSAAIVRAVREPANRWWWVVSCISMILTAYTFLFGIFSTIVGFCYAAVRERFAWSPAFRWASGSCALALLCAVPWLYIVATHSDRIAETNAWSSIAWPPMYLLAKLLLNFAAPFYDVPLYNINTAFVTVPLYLIVLAAMWCFFRSAPRDARIFVGALIAPTVLFIIFPDFVTHAHRSSVTRYLLLLYIALQLIVAYHLAALLEAKKWHTVGWLSLALILACEVQATAMQARTDIWWDNQSAWPIPEIAERVNAHGGTIIDESDWPTLLSLLPYLTKKTQLVLGQTPDSELVPGAYVLSPSGDTLQRIEARRLVAEKISLLSPLQHSVHAIGRAALTQAMNDGTATLIQIQRK